MKTLKSQIATKEDLTRLYLDIKKANSAFLRWTFVLGIVQFGVTIAAVVILLKK